MINAFQTNLWRYDFGKFRVDTKTGAENDLFLRVKYKDLPENVFYT